MTTHSTQSTVLVIGATGRHGKTGARVVEKLRHGDREVRVLVRSEDDRAARIRDLGARTVLGDLHDRRTLPAAVDGVDAIYFTYPVAAGAVHAAANLASVIKEAHLAPHLVVMSMAVAAPDSPSGLGRAQWSAEEVFEWAGLNPVVLRVAGLFFENILALHGPSIRRDDTFSNSFGDGLVPWISGRDAADLGVAALLHPERHAARRITYPPAAQLLSHHQIAEILSTAVGREIRFEHTTASRWQAELEAAALDEDRPSINTAMAQHISTIGARFAQLGAAPTITPDPDLLARSLGRQPMTFEEFAIAHRDKFAST